jgi:pimeloyl-ACP methyl ester carboxylesterase
MKPIYCIPGLGASIAIFSKLKPRQAVIRPVRLPTPTEGESLDLYALRVVELIDTCQPFWLLGQSFGGILAIEMARLCRPEKLILVSSVKSRLQLPWYGRLIGRLCLHRLAPLSCQKYTEPISLFLNGIKSAEDRALFKSFAVGRDMPLLKWSLDQTLRWPGGAVPDNLVHIHGTADRLLPARYVKPDIWVEGGTHFMIVTRAAEISTLVDRLVTN